MYKDITYQIRVVKNNECCLLRDHIRSNTGLKQGCPLSPTLANLFLYDIHKNLLIGDISLGDQNFNSISWADDLVIFSTSHAATQGLLSKLDKYCQNNDIIINLKKTKALIFCKGRRPDTPQFTSKGIPIDFCTSFKYLGIEFQQNGSFKVACKTRLEKAQNAIYLLDRTINNGGLVSTALNSKLFFSKIAPILLYGAPIWGPAPTLTLSYNPITPITVKNLEAFKTRISTRASRPIKIKVLGQERKTLKVYTTSVYDKINILKYDTDDQNFRRHCEIYELHKPFQTFLCKHAKNILGISKYASSTLACAELGWYPIQHKIITSTIKYWLRLQEGTSNKLLDNAFTFNIQSETDWINGIKSLEHDLNLGNDLSVLNLVNRILQAKYSNLTKVKIETEQHLKGYSNLNKDGHYGPQNYLTKIVNSLHRTTLTKLRTNSYSTDNYVTRNLERDHCPKCSLNEKDDLEHWLLRCNNRQLTQPRNNLLRLLKKATITNNQQLPFFDLLNCNFPNANNSTISELYKNLHRLYTANERVTANSNSV